jgi:hypothetical protein
MSICSKSICEIFHSIYNDFVKYNSVKVFIITYMFATAITVSYGTYCMLSHFQQDSCWVTFTIGILLIMSAVTMIIFSIIANCLENSIQQNLQIRTRNPY